MRTYYKLSSSATPEDYLTWWFWEKFREMLYGLAFLLLCFGPLLWELSHS